ncbi:MAG TPA: endonuclease/exonuclease/phosphatase family protein [Vicinamibacterales bacterium]|nr:endonuclease/exonuclease/phosphatase family protein [Vicinamibacterales bacterium]
MPTRPFVMSVILFSVLVDPARAAAPAPPGSPPRVFERGGVALTVMSFNIRYGTANDGPDRWELRRGQLIDLLTAQNPDVIGVQEALHFQIDEILAALPDYRMVGVGRSDGGQGGEYAAILYRASRLSVRRSSTFWFSDTPEVVKSNTWGAALERICTWALFDDREGTPFYVFNLHLDHVSQPAREKSVGLLLERIAARSPALPVVVTGDFNTGETNPATQAMLKPFRDTFRVIHRDRTDAGTFNSFKLGTIGAEKIDYVFVEPTTEVLSADIVRTSVNGRYPSDHFPVVARIRFR